MSSAGIAAVTQGMAAAESITGKIGINLTNANTNGYVSFENYLISETNKYNGGVSVTSRINANIPGDISETKNEFDYAIEGKGFFVVECNGNRKYTKAGRFEKNKDNFLVAPNGCYLLGDLYKEGELQKKSVGDLSHIELTSKTIRGKESKEAKVNVKLSANAPSIGGGKAQMIIDTTKDATKEIKDDEKFIMNFFQHKGDEQIKELSVTFVKKSTITGDAVERKGNTMDIQYTTAADLQKKMQENLSQYFKSVLEIKGEAPAISEDKIRFELNDNTKAQFEDTVDKSAFAKLDLKNIETDASNGDVIGNKDFVKSWYNPNKEGYNMASGTYSPDYLEPFTIIDSFDDEHRAFMAFKKTGFKKYAVEIYTSEAIDTAKKNGLIASAEITFDDEGKGTVVGMKEIDVKWKREAEIIPSLININWEKVEMYGSTSNIDITTDGKKEGTLRNTSIDEKGNLTGHYTNGDDKLLAAIPVAMFNDPDKLQNEFGTVFSNTAQSGSAKLALAGKNGAGAIVSGSLEGSNVDETTSMIELMKQQRFYSYNAKSYGIMNNMEDVLLNVIHA